MTPCYITAQRLRDIVNFKLQCKDDTSSSRLFPHRPISRWTIVESKPRTSGLQLVSLWMSLDSSWLCWSRCRQPWALVGGPPPSSYGYICHHKTRRAAGEEIKSALQHCLDPPRSSLCLAQCALKSASDKLQLSRNLWNIWQLAYIVVHAEKPCRTATRLLAVLVRSRILCSCSNIWRRTD